MDSPSHRLSAFGWAAALIGQFLFVFALVALSGPGRIDIIDGQTRYEVARSLVDHGDSIIRDRACWFPIYAGRDGQRYTDYRLPQSVLGMAAIVAADATGPTDEARRQFFFTLISPCMAALLAVVYAVWFRGLGHRPSTSLTWGLAGIFCTPSWFYATSTFDDILGTTAIVTAVAAAWLARTRQQVLGAAIAALALAWAVNCKPPLAIFALPVLAAGYRAEVSIRRQLLPAALVCLGVVLGVGVFMAYDAYKFPLGRSAANAEFFTGTGFGLTLNPLPGIASLALSPSCGVIWYCPTICLSWRGWRLWRESNRLFSLAVMLASLGFTLFICFLTFFKGEPTWGPRYLTPMFALCWVFVPAGVSGVSRGLAKSVLVAGLVVQLLALSVDPQRLFVQMPLHWNYYLVYPWLTFDATTSNLVQRPREIVEVFTARENPAPEYGPAPLPTHGGGINTAHPWAASLVALMAAPNAPGPLNATVAFRPIYNIQAPIMTKAALTRYHIFDSPRPWILNQWYLSEDARPVDLGHTITLLAAVAGLGIAMLMWGPVCNVTNLRRSPASRIPSSA